MRSKMRGMVRKREYKCCRKVRESQLASVTKRDPAFKSDSLSELRAAEKTLSVRRRRRPILCCCRGAVTVIVHTSVYLPLPL